MTEIEEQKVLRSWNVPLVEEITGLSPKLLKALETWVFHPVERLVIFEETGKVVSSDLAAWLIKELLRANQIVSFCYQINGINFSRSTQLFSDDDFSLTTVRSKIESADTIWVNELAVAKLTDHSQTLLYTLLENLATIPKKKIIVSCSMSAPEATGFTGVMVKKIFERKFHIVQV